MGGSQPIRSLADIRVGRSVPRDIVSSVVSNAPIAWLLLRGAAKLVMGSTVWNMIRDAVRYM